MVPVAVEAASTLPSTALSMPVKYVKAVED